MSPMRLPSFTLPRTRLSRTAVVLAALMLLAALPLIAAGQPAAAFCDDPGVSDISLAECRALEELYLNTNGSGWTDLAKQGWLQDSTACTWQGISCEAVTTTNAAAATKQVSGITIVAGGLSGPLPASLADLTQLTVLDLTDNQLTGSLPPALGTLSLLEDLSLGRNQLTGPIPVEVGDLSALQTLDLGNNQLSETIPEELARLNNLAIFFLDGNRLEGPVPKDICTMSNTLISSSLDFNKLDVYTTPASCDARFANWALTQTVPPTGVSASSKAVNTVQGTTAVTADITVEWQPISYQGNGGNYQVFARNLATNDVMDLGTTGSKSVGVKEITFPDDPKNYAFFVRTNTDSHDRNQTALTSEKSDEALLDAVAVRLLDIEANTPLLYLPALAPLLLLALTVLAAVVLRRKQ